MCANQGRHEGGKELVMKEKIIHLLIPKEFRVWCLPNRAPDFAFTKYPSKATCGNCLTKMRASTNDKKTRFMVYHTSRDMGYGKPVLPENL